MVTKSNFFNKSLVKIKIKLKKVFLLNVEKKLNRSECFGKSEMYNEWLVIVV